jgi:hypothetical protein
MELSRKEVKGFADDGFDIDERREISEAIDNGEDDFEVGRYRFISSGAIDSILKDELLSDKYVLGCFQAWFIADITGLDIDVIEKAQENDSMELIGALMEQHIDEVVDGVVSGDGYGLHFAGYDGNANERAGYYFFRVN